MFRPTSIKYHSKAHLWSTFIGFICFAFGCTSNLFSEESLILSQIKTVSLPHVKGGFDLMAIDIEGKRLFLAATDNNSVEIIDVDSGKSLKSITGFNQPKWIVYRPELKKLYVSNGGDGTVRVLDPDSFRTLKSIDFKEKANNLRYDPNTKELFVGYGKTFGAIGIIDTTTDTVTQQIKLANFPKQFELDPEGKRIYVNVPTANNVAVIDRPKRTVVETWQIKEEKENVPMAQDKGNQRLLIGCDPGKLIVLDLKTGKSVASLPINSGADGIYYDPSSKLIYISCAEGFIDVVQQTDPNHYQLKEKLPTASGAGTSLFVPELKLLFLAVPQEGTQKAELRMYEVTP